MFLPKFSFWKQRKIGECPINSWHGGVSNTLSENACCHAGYTLRTHHKSWLKHITPNRVLCLCSWIVLFMLNRGLFVFVKTPSALVGLLEKNLHTRYPVITIGWTIIFSLKTSMQCPDCRAVKKEVKKKENQRLRKIVLMNHQVLTTAINRYWWQSLLRIDVSWA